MYSMVIFIILKANKIPPNYIGVHVDTIALYKWKIKKKRNEIHIIVTLDRKKKGTM